MVAFSQILLKGGRALGEGGGIERGGIWGQEDKGEGGSGAFSFGKGGRLWNGGGGVCSGNCTPPTCMSPPIVPPAGWTGLFGPLERTCLPPFPPNPPVSPTHADHKRSQNDPKNDIGIILVSFWYHFGFVLVSFWYHFGIIGLPVFFLHLRTLQEGPLPFFFGRGAPAPALTPKTTPTLPS